MTGYALGMKDENGYQYPLRAITSPALVRTAIALDIFGVPCSLFRIMSFLHPTGPGTWLLPGGS